jgi:hypothetical protein
MEAQVDAFEPNLPALLIFAAAWAACCIGGIHLAGMLPLSSAPAAVRSRGGAALVIMNGVLLAALLALTVAFSYRELRWPSAVVVGGTIFLFASCLRLSPFRTCRRESETARPGSFCSSSCLSWPSRCCSSAAHHPV